MATKKTTTTEEVTEDPQGNNNSNNSNQNNNQGAAATPSYITKEDMEKQLAGFGTFTQEEKENLTKFVDAMGVVLDVIDSNPQLKQGIQDGVKSKYGENPQGVSSQQSNQGQGQNSNSQIPSGEIENVKGEVASVSRSRRAEIIENFEKQYGISSLPETEQLEIRKKLGGKLLSWGHKIDAIPVDHLKGLMEDAYITVAPEKLADQGYVKGILAARSGAAGNMPAMASSTISNNNDNNEGKLTAAQSNYIEKLGVDETKAKETMKTNPY